MNLQGHLNRLLERHATLETKIQQEAHAPQPNELLIHTMKKEKLRLKDEISHYQPKTAA